MPIDASLRFHIVDVLHNDSGTDREHGFIELYGVTSTGQSIKVDVDFELYFYVELPDDFVESQLEDVNAYLNKEVWCAKIMVVRRELARLEAARPYTFHKKTNLLKLVFRKQKHLQMTKAALAKLSHLDVCGTEHPLNLFETDMRPVERFNSLHLNPVAGVLCRKYSVIPKGGQRETTTDLHVRARVEDLAIDAERNEELPTHVVSLTYDIETTTLDATEQAAQVLMISCVLCGRHAPKEQQQPTVDEELHAKNEQPAVSSEDLAVKLKAKMDSIAAFEAFVDVVLFTWKPTDPIAGVRIVECANESECIRQFHRFVMDNDVDVLVGHNMSGFDANYLYKRAEILFIDTYRVFGRNNEESKLRPSVSKRDAAFVSAPGRLQVDTMDFLRAYGKKQDDYTLRTCATKLLPPALTAANAKSALDRSLVWRFEGQPPDIAAMLTHHKGDVPHQEIAPLYFGTSVAERTRLARYCVKDSLLTARLYVDCLMFLRLFTMAQIFRVSMQTVLNSGLQDKVISQMFTQMHQQNMFYNKYHDPDHDPFRHLFEAFSYKGGAVHQPKRGKYNEPICVLDFSGMYPSIIMHHNICMNSVIDKASLTAEQYAGMRTGRALAQTMTWCSTDVVRIVAGYACSQYVLQFSEFDVEGRTVIVVQETDAGFLPAIQKRFAALRKRYKEAKASATDDFKRSLWDCCQLAVKIAQNAMYGFFAVAKGARFAYPLVAATITQIGRNMNFASVQLTKQHFAGADVMYGDSVTGDTPLIVRRVLTCAGSSSNTAVVSTNASSTSTNTTTSSSNIPPSDDDDGDKSPILSHAVIDTGVAQDGCARQQQQKQQQQQHQQQQQQHQEHCKSQTCQDSNNNNFHSDESSKDELYVVRIDELSDLIAGYQCTQNKQAKAPPQLWQSYGEKQAISLMPKAERYAASAGNRDDRCYGWEVWSDSGFTPIQRLIRHVARKPLMRITTPTGLVDATTDHSLLRPNGERVRPSELSVGQRLLHKPDDALIAQLNRNASLLVAQKQQQEQQQQQQPPSDSDHHTATAVGTADAARGTVRCALLQQALGAREADAVGVTACGELRLQLDNWKRYAFVFGVFAVQGHCEWDGDRQWYTWRINNVHRDVLEQCAQVLPFATRIVEAAPLAARGARDRAHHLVRCSPSSVLGIKATKDAVALSPQLLDPCHMFRVLFYNQHGDKHVPSALLAAPLDIVRSFWRGFCLESSPQQCGNSVLQPADGVASYIRIGNLPNKQMSAELWLLARRLGYSVNFGAATAQDTHNCTCRHHLRISSGNAGNNDNDNDSNNDNNNNDTDDLEHELECENEHDDQEQLFYDALPSLVCQQPMFLARHPRPADREQHARILRLIDLPLTDTGDATDTESDIDHLDSTNTNTSISIGAQTDTDTDTDSRGGSDRRRHNQDQPAGIFSSTVVTSAGAMVYDLETASHHFHVAPGDLVVHNTDSIMVKFNYSDCKTDEEKLSKAFRCGAELAKIITQSQISEYIEITLEKIYFPFCLYDRKKYYTGRKWTWDAKKAQAVLDPKVDTVGGEIKKRDTCPDLRELLASINEMLLSPTTTPTQIMQFAREHLCKMVNGKIAFQKFVRIVELSADPENYKQLSGHVSVALRNRNRGQTDDCKKGGRVSFVHVLQKDDYSNSKKKVRDTTEDAKFAEGAIRRGEMKLDYEYYLNRHYANAVLGALSVLDVNASKLLDDARGIITRKQATNGRTLAEVFALGAKRQQKAQQPKGPWQQLEQSQQSQQSLPVQPVPSTVVPSMEKDKLSVATDTLMTNGAVARAPISLASTSTTSQRIRIRRL